MGTKLSLQTVIDRYRYHWDFAELDLSDINRQCYPDDDALLHLVTRIGNLEEIEMLVASGARVNASGDMGFTPLHYAAMRGRLDVAEKLIELGADPSTRNEWGDTSADTAANGGHKKLATLLQTMRRRKRQGRP